jgi:hypothetical protein
MCGKDEQDAILNEVESRFSVVSGIEVTLVASFRRAGGLHQSLLARALTGELFDDYDIEYACRSPCSLYQNQGGMMKNTARYYLGRVHKIGQLGKRRQPTQAYCLHVARCDNVSSLSSMVIASGFFIASRGDT